MKPGILYVLKNKHYEDYFKIGRTRDLKARLYHYNGASPEDVVTVQYQSYPFKDSVKAERMLMTKLGKATGRLEWYDAADIDTAIDTIIYLEGLEEDNLI